jgi:hypothetical protein
LQEHDVFKTAKSASMLEEVRQVRKKPWGRFLENELPREIM